MDIFAQIYIICGITLHSTYENLQQFSHVLNLPGLRSKLGSLQQLAMTEDGKEQLLWKSTGAFLLTINPST